MTLTLKKITTALVSITMVGAIVFAVGDTQGASNYEPQAATAVNVTKDYTKVIVDVQNGWTALSVMRMTSITTLSGYDVYITGGTKDIAKTSTSEGGAFDFEFIVPFYITGFTFQLFDGIYGTNDSTKPTVTEVGKYYCYVYTVNENYLSNVKQTGSYTTTITGNQDLGFIGTPTHWGTDTDPYLGFDTNTVISSYVVGLIQGDEFKLRYDRTWIGEQINAQNMILPSGITVGTEPDYNAVVSTTGYYLIRFYFFDNSLRITSSTDATSNKAAAIQRMEWVDSCLSGDTSNVTKFTSLINILDETNKNLVLSTVVDVNEYQTGDGGTTISNKLTYLAS